MSTDIAIRLERVSRVFGEGSPTQTVGLWDVSMEIVAGEFVAIVGPSGGGKTTLISILGLLDTPSSGEYYFKGEATSGLRDRDRTRLRAFTLGFVFQSFHLLDRRQVRDSVEMGLMYQGAGIERRTAITTDVLSRLDLGDKAQTIASLLSGGQRQRVAIARALATENPIILADEPTGNLDSESGRTVLHELVQFHKDGGTVVVVTHSDEVAAVADRRIRIVDGRVVADSGRSTPPRTEVGSSVHPPRRRPRFFDFFRDALGSVASQGRQTFSLIAAVAIAVGLVVVSIGLGQSAGAQVSDTFDRYTNRDVSAQWLAADPEAPDPRKALEATSQLAGVDATSLLADLGASEIRTDAATVTVTLQSSLGEFARSTDSVVSPSVTDRGDLRSGTALVGATLARQLSLAPLQNSPTLLIFGRPYAVVGTIESSRRYPNLTGQVVVPFEDAKEYGTDAKLTLAIRATNGAAQQVGRQVPAAISPNTPSAVRITVPTEVNVLRRSIESGLQSALIAFALLACLIAIFMLANSISASVHARTGEFGLRRAVGARASDLTTLVALESSIVGAAGGVVGLILGLVVILGFTVTQAWLPVFDLTLAPVAVVTGVLIAVLSSASGAIRASRLDPSSALRS